MGRIDRTGTPLVFSRQYSVEELYGLIQDLPFEAGHPKLAVNASSALIVWPQLDPVNQIQIAEKGGRLLCYRSTKPAQTEGLLPPGFWCRFCTFLRDLFGTTPDRCRELAAITGKQINSLNL